MCRPRVRQRPRAHAASVHGRSAPRGPAAVPGRRLWPLAARGQAGVPRPPGYPGQDQWLPDRDRRDREHTVAGAWCPRRRSRGHRAGRPQQAPRGLLLRPAATRRQRPAGPAGRVAARVHDPVRLPLAEKSGVDGQRQDRQEGVNGARQRIRCRRAGPRRAEYGDRAPAGGRMGGRARHPEGQDRPAGSLLVRGLGLRDVAETEAVFRRLASLMTEKEAFAPRRSYSDGVYSSSKWPPNQPMCMHHELSYVLEFPCLMLFACLMAPTDGGATPVADSPTVLRALPTELIKRFEKVGWLLIRNYNDDIGASVADAFGTDDRRAVEDYCRANAIKFEWQPDGALRTWQRRSAVVHHPLTGQQCWFNQIAFLNEWTIDPEVREYLVDIYGEDGLPFNTRFGDGDPIGSHVVQLINEGYEANTVRERWQAGDLTLVANVRTAHATERFEGPREVLVAMADAVHLADCSPTIEVTAS